MQPEAPTPQRRPSPRPKAPAIARTNTAAAWSLASSLLGLAMLLPIVGSIFGILGGRRAVKQIDETGEGGGGIAEAAIVFGWFGLVSSSIALIGIVVILVAAARS